MSQDQHHLWALRSFSAVPIKLGWSTASLEQDTVPSLCFLTPQPAFGSLTSTWQWGSECGPLEAKGQVGGVECHLEGWGPHVFPGGFWGRHKTKLLSFGARVLPGFYAYHRPSDVLGPHVLSPSPRSCPLWLDLIWNLRHGIGMISRPAIYWDSHLSIIHSFTKHLLSTYCMALF